MPASEVVRRVAATALLGAMALVSSCSERIASVDERRIDIEIRTSVEALGEAAQTLTFVLTVTGLGIVEPIVVPLALISNGLLSGSVEVPSGPARLFRIDAFDGEGMLLYSGQATADVPRGGEVRLDIVLEPRVPMIKVSPTYLETVQGDVLTLKISVYNLADISAIEASLSPYDSYGQTFYWPYGTEVILNPDLYDLSDREKSYYLFDDLNTLHIVFVLLDLKTRFVDEKGYAELATIRIPTSNYDAYLEKLIFDPAVLSMTDKLGNELPVADVHPVSSVVLFYAYETRLMALWDMGSVYENATLIDEQINNLDGLATGTEVVDGIDGAARSFDGIDDFIEVPDSDLLDIRSEIGISMWVRRPTDALTPLASLICKRTENGPINYQILIEDRSAEDGYLSFLFRYAGARLHTYRVDVPDNAASGWFHLAFSFRFGDPSSAFFAVGYECAAMEAVKGNWIDGDGAGAAPNASGGLYIGKNNGGVESFFRGELDEIELANIAWSLPVIQHYSYCSGWCSRRALVRNLGRQGPLRKARFDHWCGSTDFTRSRE